MRDPSLCVVHTTAGVGATAFGLGQVPINLAKAQSVLGCDARIWCGSSAEDVRWATTSGDLRDGQISRFDVQGPSWFGYSRSMAQAAKMYGGNVAIVHQHGIWTYASRVTTLLHRHHGTPYVVAPHGSLERWALHRSKWKKAIALAAYERAHLGLAGCLHATSESEVQDFRNLGLRNPIALIPNGVSDHWLSSEGQAARFRGQYSIPENRRILLYLSRITPKKNLLGLVRAIHMIRSELSDWLLIVAGTDEFSHQSQVERLVDQSRLRSHVRFVGPLFDQPKRDAFAAADLFVLPSYSEGSPIVVLDSLAAGVPVITTQATPWQDLVTHACGWWTAVSEEALAATLREATGVSTAQLKIMGKRGQNLVASCYAWTQIAQKTVGLYEWLLGRGPKPDTVVSG
jgi:glycosyltransferase involved in cell wall biosynthesis